ncbi:MAG: hypothetical protein IKI04_00570, partial [Bacilli bacterium]|nr:hypothetical protein [Bacilli bacterium]
MEFILIGAILIFIVTYRNSSGEGIYKFLKEQANVVYDTYAPYSYKVMRDKIKELGLEYSTRQYTLQAAGFAIGAGIVGYLYFYNLVVVIVYAIIAVSTIPYITYLRCKRQYSEFIFEQIQVYTTNTIMEFNTTQSFVKSLEGVVESGVLEDPVLTDVKTMIALSYEKGDVTDSINYMNSKYPYYMVKNMHQLFLQVTKEGAKNTEETFDNMLSDIGILVEGVYRDRSDRKQFHGQFLVFGVSLYSLIMLIQLILGVDSYIEMLDCIMMRILVHGV